jgi:hypothetical protein
VPRLPAWYGSVAAVPERKGRIDVARRIRHLSLTRSTCVPSPSVEVAGGGFRQVEGCTPPGPAMAGSCSTRQWTIWINDAHENRGCALVDEFVAAAIRSARSVGGPHWQLSGRSRSLLVRTSSQA